MHQMVKIWSFILNFFIRTFIIFGHAKIKDFRGRQKEPPANSLNSALYGTAAKLQSLSASQGLGKRTLLWNRSETANYFTQQTFQKRKSTMEPLQNCKVWVPVKGLKNTLSYRTAAKLQILSACQSDFETLKKAPLGQLCTKWTIWCFILKLLIKTGIIFYHAKIKDFRGRQKEPPANGLNSVLEYRFAAKQLPFESASQMRQGRRDREGLPKRQNTIKHL